MKFDFVIGNPPYQIEVEGNGRQSPVYNLFMEEAYNIADCVELITPARFLSNAGQTPKAWNEKMLNDEHLKILDYEPDSSKIFPNTEIKGGVVITIRNINKKYGKIGIFRKYGELSNIIPKITSVTDNFLDSFVTPQGLYRFSNILFEEHPNVLYVTGTGTKNKIVSRLLELLPDIFLDNEPQDVKSVKLLGRIKGKRVYKYIKRNYLQENNYINSYNIAFPEGTGIGKFGEVLSTPEILYPNEGTTDTFLSIGSFKTEYEANSAVKYIKTKFLRALMGVFKATQHTTSAVWKLVPLQDFTPESDIDWSLSIPEIDQRLYKKYGFTQEEIDFIETKVMEME